MRIDSLAATLGKTYVDDSDSLAATISKTYVDDTTPDWNYFHAVCFLPFLSEKQNAYKMRT